MAKKITWKDLADFSENQPIKEAVKQLNLLNKEYTRLSKNMKAQSKHITNALRDVQKSSAQLTATTQKLTVEQQKQTQELTKMAVSASKAATQALNLKKAKENALMVEKTFGNSVAELTKKVKEQKKAFDLLDPTIKKDAAAMAKLGKEIRITKDKIKDLNAVTLRQNNAFERAETSYNGLVKKNQQLRQQLKNLPGAFSKNTKEVEAFRQKSKQLEVQIAANNNKLRTFDKRIGDNFRNIGNYKSALAGATANMKSFALQLTATTLGLMALFQAAKRGFTSFVDFEFTMASVKALSGATAQEFKSLEDQAKDLGSTTSNTAGQVAQLQLELVKLGFTPEEINKSTEAINKLSIAFKTDLGETARIVASTLNAFNMEAEESTHVADLFAKASATSALDIEKIGVAMANVAPASAAANISLETTLSILGKFVDRGVDASSASTGLRNILLELSDSGSKLAKELGGTIKSEEDLFVALEKLAEGGIDQAVAMIEAGKATGALGKVAELTGKRTAIALLNIVKTRDEIQKQNEVLADASGFLEEYSAIMEGTVKIAMDRATSAAEGFAIALFEEMKPAINAIITLVIGLFSALQAGVKIISDNKELFLALGAAIMAARIQTALMTIATIKNNVVQKASIFTINGVKKAWQGLTAAMKLNPLGFIVAGLFALVGALKFAERWTSRYKKLQESTNNILKKASERTNLLRMVNTNLAKQTEDMVNLTEARRDAIIRENEAIIENTLAKIKQLKADQLLAVQQALQLTLWQKAQVAIATAANAASGAALSARFAALNVAEATSVTSAEIDILEEEVRILDEGLSHFESERDKEHKNALGRSKAEREAITELQIFRLQTNIKWRQREFDEDETHAQRKVELIRSNADDLLEIENLKWAALQKTLKEGTAEYELAYEKFWTAVEQISFDTTQSIKKIMEEEFVVFRDLGISLDDVEKALEDGMKRIKKKSKKISKGVDDDWKKAFANIAGYSKEAFNNAAGFAGQLLENQIANSEFRIEQLEDERKRDIELAGNNQALQDKINQDAEAKRVQLEAKKRSDQTKQARLDKATALFNAVIGTSVAVVKSLPNVALSILAGALGAIQIATIASQPIPQFATGTDSAPEGLAITGEKGDELIVNPDGSMQISNKGAQLTYLKKGAQVFTKDETSKIAQSALNNDTDIYNRNESALVRSQEDTNRLALEIKEGNQKVVDAVKNIDRLSIQGTKRGLEMFKQNQKGRTELLNNRYS